MKIFKFEKYKQNLQLVNDTKLYSYTTNVAIVEGDKLIVQAPFWWSATTSKHINYAASELSLEIIK